MKVLTVSQFNLRHVLIGLVLAILSTASCAEDRIIEESLVYKDPTVAPQDQWVKGISVDYWAVKNSSTSSIGTINYSYNEPGVSGFVGYGDISVLASYKKAKFSFSPMQIASLNATYSGSANVTAFEISARWLIRKLAAEHLTPYVLIGYGKGTTDTAATLQDNATNTTLATITSNGTSQFKEIGIGAILPVNSTVGFRVDTRYGTSSATDNIRPTAVTAKGNSYTATMYYNIAKGWNAQLGAKLSSSGQASDGTPGSKFTGYYTTLGYSFR